MRRILILNSNTTPGVTDLVIRHARISLGEGYELIPATARFGAPYISTEAAYVIAGHAALDALAEAGKDFDSVLLACFGDPGLFALKEVSAVPVVGLAEAAMIEAGAHGRCSIVTGGVRWKVMLERLALALGVGAQIASIRPIEWTGERIAADPEGAIAFLVAEVRAAVSADGAQAVILGGAALAGLGARIAPLVEVPVIDSVYAGARVAARLARGARAHAPVARPATPTVGIGVALERMLA
jgi:Asp/Glu/hydantoin racemase